MGGQSPSYSENFLVRLFYVMKELVNLLRMCSLGCSGQGERQIRGLLVLFYSVEKNEIII